ncbi:hypothetical protein [Nocardia terpenica]|uniref:hypothetical protein n=1 Tax=Nocardia terpenica TaxID=455432 RepID=UPI001581595C|nr:hypothetical protein [Nocardia terpenica]
MCWCSTPPAGSSRALERRDPDAVAARTQHGPLPTMAEFATAVADAAAADTEPGHTVYIGGADYLSRH